jgi:hypothetical protein
MKNLCNTAFGQSFLLKIDKIYQSKYNVTILGVKRPAITEIKLMPKSYYKGKQLNYPPENGFVPGTKHTETLQPGTIIDRFGGESGTFVAPEGVPFAERAIPPWQYAAGYHRYEVLKPIEVDAGTAIPWFNQSGGGTQYDLKYSIEYLIDGGYLSRIISW